MVQNEDEQPFLALTFSQLMHPETAASTIDSRYQDQSPWATVYYEAVSGPTNYGNIPVAMNVVAVADDIEEANPQQPLEFAPPQHEPRGLAPLGASADGDCAPQLLPRPQPWQHSNLVDLIIGFSLSLVAFIFTIKIELTAIIIYTLAAGFHFLAEEVFSSTPALLGKSICLTITGALMIVDPILLTVSVLVTEIIGCIALLLCSIFGGARSGNAWQQFIRKTCHLSRWGFRSCHKGWKPERVFPISMEDERFQLNPLPTEDQHDHDMELGSTSRPYRDVATHSPSACSCASTDCPTCSTEESTFVSEVTFAHEDDTIEYPPIAIAPENVSVVQEEDVSHEEPLFKNSQHVHIT